MSNYRPWRYADRALVRQRRADQFRQRAEERDYRSIEATQRAQLPPTGYGGTTAAALDKKSGGGSLWKKAKGAADAVTPDLAEDAVKGAAKGALKGALTTLDAPRKYVGAPAFGVLSGLTEADREYDPKTGRYYRKTATIKEAGKGILDAFTQNPAKTYREGKQAAEEYAADPNKNVLHRAGLNIATDPLSYVGPGLAAKGVKAAGLSGKGGRVAYEVLDSGGPGVVIGGNVAASAEQEYGEKVPGWNRLSPELRSLGAALVGGVTGGTALRGAKMETAAGRGERGSIDFTKKGPQKSPDLIKVRHADIQELPGTFQARNADEGKSYSEDRVKELQRIWDPNQLEPGSLVRDTNTGELTVFSGHHRKVLMERQAAAGLYPDEGTWEVYDADLSNPAHVKELQRIADYKNYGTATMKLNENVRVYRRAKARGETDDVIFDSMRSVNRLERQYLPYLADMPDDLIERVMQANGSIANLGEIGKAARTYGFTEPEIRAFFGRYGTGGKGQEITPTALKAKLETVGRDIDAIRAQKKQGGMFDDDVIAKVLVTVDEIDAADAELRIQRARLVSTDKQLAEIEAKAPPELVEATAQLRTYIQGEVRRLERERAKGIADYESTKRAKWEGTPDPGDNQRPVPEGDGGRPEVPGRAAPQAGTRVTNPEVGTWIDQGGTPVEVVAKEGAQIRVRGGDGSESWIQTAPDMFGESPTFTVTEKPLAERPRPVQTETGTQQGFGGSVQELPGMNPPAPKPPEAAPTPEVAVRPTEPEAPRPEEPAVPRAETPPPPKEEFGPEDFEPKGPPPPLSKTNDHATLGLDPSKTYTADEIRAAYRAQARLYHPDVNTSATATADMKTINAAFERLSGKSAAGPRPGAARDAGNRPEWDRWQEQYRRARDDARRWADEQDAARQRARERWRNEAPEREARRTEMRRENVEGFEQAGMEPPVGSAPPPGAPPVPPQGIGPGNPQFPAGGGGATGADLLRLPDRAQALAGETSYQGSWQGRVDQGVRQAMARIGMTRLLGPNIVRDPRLTPVWQGLNHVNNLRQSFKAEVEQMFNKLEQTGVKFEQQADGNWHVAGTNLQLGDMVEGATPQAQAAWQALSPEARTAASDLASLMQRGRQTVERYGGTVPIDPSIQGEYFPRVVKAKGGVEKTRGATTRRRLGSEQGFAKERTQDSMLAGEQGQITYAHPREAFEAGLDQRLKAAGDAWAKGMLEPLATPGAIPGIGTRAIPGLEGSFANDIADRIDAGTAVDPSTGVRASIKAVNAVLTPLRASFDASATFQQGMRLWLDDPGAAARYWSDTVRSLKDPDIYYNTSAKLDGAGPGVERMLTDGLHLTPDKMADEFTLPGKGAGNNPATKAYAKGRDISNEHFSRVLNLYRKHSYNNAYARATARGLAGDALDAEMKHVTAAINRSFGWTGRKPSSIESMLLFAPRYFMANVETLAKAATDFKTIEGSMARKHIGLLAAEGAALVTALNAVRGYPTEYDPRSNNFMRVRNVGGLDVSIYGSYDTLFRGIAGTLGGKEDQPIRPDIKRVWKLAEAKMSPAVKLLYEPLRGQTYLGEPLDPFGSWEGAGKTLYHEAKSSLPFPAQNLIEGVERGEGALTTLGDTGLGSTGLSSRPTTPTERRNMTRDEQARKLFSKRYDDLTGEQRSQVNATPNVTGWQNRADKDSMKRGGESAERVENRKLFKERMAANAKYLAAGKDDEGNPFSGNDYRDAYHELQTFLAGRKDTLKSEYKSDKEVSGWFDLYDTAAKANGQIDFAKLDSLQAAYRSAHPDIDGKVDAITGTSDDATLREYRRAQGLAKMYYDLPSYRGLTKEQADHANEVLMQAQDLVSFGEVRDFQAALRKLGRDDPTGASLARRAKRAGSNPARKRFRTSHPLLARYYSDITNLDAA